MLLFNIFGVCNFLIGFFAGDDEDGDGGVEGFQDRDIVCDGGNVAFLNRVLKSRSDEVQMEGLGRLSAHKIAPIFDLLDFVVPDLINRVGHRNSDGDGFVGLEGLANICDDSLGDKRPRGVMEEKREGFVKIGGFRTDFDGVIGRFPPFGTSGDDFCQFLPAVRLA